jgi:hypothetical protein
VQQELIELSMRALDLAAIDRLPAIEHVHQKFCAPWSRCDRIAEHLHLAVGKRQEGRIQRQKPKFRGYHRIAARASRNGYGVCPEALVQG